MKSVNVWWENREPARQAEPQTHIKTDVIPSRRLFTKQTFVKLLVTPTSAHFLAIWMDILISKVNEFRFQQIPNPPFFS